jgi:uncharacterized membrane protein YgcG
MRQTLRACAIGFALLGSSGLAFGQSGSSQAPGQQKAPLHLNQTQERAVTQGLSGEQTQSSSGPQAQIGSKLPDSMNAHKMPNDVTAQIPEMKNYLFVKLPDRVLLIDPDNMLVAEIIPASDTTGSGSPGTGGGGASGSGASGSGASGSGSSSGQK